MSIRARSWLAGAALVLICVACEQHAEPSTFTYELGGTSPSEGDAGRGDVLDGAAFACDALEVEAACGQCQFGLPGEGCALAVRVGETAWFVDGTAIDDHGDAHADDGFCNSVRKAVVSGRVAEGRFVATSFELAD